MAIQQCERCGADLPPTAPGATVTCGYCGVEQRLSMLPQPAAPARTLPAIARVDAGRARTLFELFLREIQRESGVDVRREGQAVERLVRAAAQAVLELDAAGATDVNLPFLTATAAGPIHYQRHLTRADLESAASSPFGSAGNPFAPAASARYATREDIASELQVRQQARQESSRTGCIVTSAILLFVGVAVGVGAIASSGGDSSSSTSGVAAAVSQIVPAVVAPPKTPADADREDAWVELPEARMPGDATRFDPVANLPWAVAIAQEWSPDAALESFYVSRVRADGTLNAGPHGDDPSNEPDADYRFVSATRRAQAAQRIQVAENDVKSSFRIWVHDGKVQVMGDTERADDFEDHVPTPLTPEPTCHLDQVLAKMRERGLALRPAWDLCTTWDEDDHDWTWSINMTDIGDTPRIDATTCRVER